MSQIHFRPIDLTGPEDFEAIIRWESDPEIASLTTPCREEGHPPVSMPAEERCRRYREQSPAYFMHYFMILDGARRIGNVTLTMDPGHLLHKIPGSAWVGLTIGERSHWGKGLGKLCLDYLEELARESGACRIELGVFEHNKRAHALYLKAGYCEIGRVPKSTLAAGHWWDDIRLEKKLA